MLELLVELLVEVLILNWSKICFIFWYASSYFCCFSVFANNFSLSLFLVSYRQESKRVKFNKFYIKYIKPENLKAQTKNTMIKHWRLVFFGFNKSPNQISSSNLQVESEPKHVESNLNWLINQLFIVARFNQFILQILK